MAYARGIVVAVVCLFSAMFVAQQFTWAAHEKVLCGKTDSKSTFLLTYEGNLKDVSTHGCSPTIVNAFNALKDMTYMEPICTMSKVKKITIFYETYLNEQDKRCFINKKSSQPIKELARYAILYGMEAGDSCKQIMNEQLDSGTLLDESNVHALKPWINDDGQIARLIKLIPDRLISFPMPSDFSLLDPEFEDELMEAVEEENNKNLPQAKWVCEHRLRQLYKKIVFPIAHLDRNGLNLRSGLGNRELIANKQHALLKRIVFLCELLTNAKNIATVSPLDTEKDINAEGAMDTLDRSMEIDDALQRHQYSLYIAKPFSGSEHFYYLSYSSAKSPVERFSELLFLKEYYFISVEQAVSLADEKTRRIMMKVIESAKRLVDNKQEEKMAPKKRANFFKRILDADEE